MVDRLDQEQDRPFCAPRVGGDHSRWEQAFSHADRNWETSWTVEFTPAEPAAICEGGRSRR